jgi:hypothetical protein
MTGQVNRGGGISGFGIAKEKETPLSGTGGGGRAWDSRRRG